MDKQKFILSLFFVISSLILIFENSEAKSKNKGNFLKDYEKVVEILSENNHKNSKEIYYLFSNIEKKYDLLNSNFSKIRIGTVYYYICDGMQKYDGAQIKLLSAAETCKKSYDNYKKAGVFNGKKNKYIETTISELAGTMYTYGYYYTNKKEYLRLANKFNDIVLKSKPEKFSKTYTQALKNKVIIYRAQLKIDKALEYSELVLKEFGCFKNRNEQKYLSRCADEKSDYSIILMDTGLDSNYEYAAKYFKEIIKYELIDNYNIATRNSARVGLHQYYTRKRNFEEAEKYIYEAVTLAKDITGLKETYFENLRKLFKTYIHTGGHYQARNGLKNLIIEAEKYFGKNSIQLIHPFSDFIVMTYIPNTSEENKLYARKLEKILKKNKKHRLLNSYGYSSLGAYYLKIENYEKAEKFFKKALQYDHNNTSQGTILLAKAQISLNKNNEAKKNLDNFKYKNSHEKLLYLTAKTQLSFNKRDIKNYKKNLLQTNHNLLDYSKGIISEKGSPSILNYSTAILNLLNNLTDLKEDEFNTVNNYFNLNDKNLNISIIELFEIIRNSKINKSIENIIDRSSNPVVSKDKKELQNLILEFEKLPKVSEDTENIPDLAKKLSNFKTKIFKKKELIALKLNIKKNAFHKELNSNLIQESLNNDQAIISYYIDRNKIYIKYLSKNKILVKKIDINKEEIKDHIKAIRRSVLVNENGSLNKFDFNSSQKLYKKLISPIENFIKNKKELIIIPHRSLLSIPFEILVSNNSSQIDYKNVNWLGKKYAINYYPSIYSFLNLNELISDKNNQELAFLGFGNPKLKSKTKIASKSNKKTDVMLRGIANIDEILKMSELPETAEELKIISKIFSNNSTLILGEKFTEDAIKALDFTKFQYISFATHAVTANQISGISEPGLILTPPNQSTKQNDGILSSSEIEKLNLNSDIIILSACNTASQDGTPNGEGLSGLTSSFFQAGTKSMLVTHWDVETNSASRLTTETFKNLKRNKNLKKALQQTKISMMNDPSTSHPFFWAPFVLIGNLNF